MKTETVSGCVYAKKCGGCSYQGIPYPAQLQKKQQRVSVLLKPFGKVSPIIGMEDPYHYRNKVHAVFDRDRRGNVISGIYEANSHHVVPVEDCLIEDRKSQEIIHTIRDMLKSFRIKTYDEDTGYGLLRHVLVRRGFATGEIMVVLVTASPVLPSKNNFVKALLKEHPEITTVVQNLNDRKTSMVLGDRNIVLYGKGYIHDVLCGRSFRISPGSFYQVNPVQTEILYRTAVDFAGLNGTERVIDAYCGIGTISLLAAGHAGQVLGVEQNPDAVRDARINARENKIKNAEFFVGDAGQFMDSMAAQGERTDVVFMDPPRTGSDKKFLTSAVNLCPDRIVYISCNPETLARDLRYLTRHGYVVQKIQPVDMFGFTEHVETVVQLSQQKPDDVIRVGLDLDELDITAAESKATYQEIKAYVKEQTGLSVSSLYIAQVKQKYGIIERENYNLSKSEDARQPQCPPEKEKAIVEALRHFKMIEGSD
ncbi:MAG: 23S rRNA (uracil(1939)-C(5))-methyltransferase RlmD [Clostridiales bacterium]|nr:23S rRNA (uracil(1939)-C(5))-methyltransferase RlmD [Clostridiales bacterium]